MLSRLTIMQITPKTEDALLQSKKNSLLYLLLILLQLDLFIAGCSDFKSTKSNQTQHFAQKSKVSAKNDIYRLNNKKFKKTADSSSSLPSVNDPAKMCKQMADTLKPLDKQTTSLLKPFWESLPVIQVISRVHPDIYFKLPQKTLSLDAQKIVDSIPDTYRARRVIHKIIKKYKSDPAFLRKLFLSEGYLFETDFHIASALVKELSFELLFNEPQIYIHKNGRIQTLKLIDGVYYDGLKKAKLVIGTRVSAAKEDLLVPYHYDMDYITGLTGARRILPLKTSEYGMVAELFYPDDQHINVVFKNNGLKTEVACQMSPPGTLAKMKKNSLTFWNWIKKLETTAELMVTDRPDFDEPENEPESVQEDGKLRIEWEKSYRQRKKIFVYRDLEYNVFNRAGNPVPPEVCIDFVIDTWERASGNWYKKRKKRPGRTKGFLDFDTIEHLNTRHTPSILNYAKENLLPFERYDFEYKTRIPFKKLRKFATAIQKNAQFIKQGDLLVIHGLREEDMKEHFHTVLVLDTYPVTGIPSVVADNAGKPRIRNLASAMRSAPRRMIKYRLRLNWQWLQTQMQK